MLALSRRIDESINIGDRIRITILSIRGDRVRVGIDAPADVKILRSELTELARPFGFLELLKREISTAEPELLPGLNCALDLFERGRAARVSDTYTNEELANYCEGVNGPAWRAYAGMVEAGEIKSYHDLKGIIRPDVFAQVETYFSGGRHVS